MKGTWQTTGWLTKLLCPHTTMRVIRWHPDVIREDMRGKELYVDRYNVLNFVQCCRCNKIFKTAQIETLYDEQIKDVIP